MKIRAMLAAVLGAALLVPSVSVAVYHAEAAPRNKNRARAARKPKITSARATPTRLKGTGGSVNLAVSVNPYGAVVNSVRATVTVPNSGNASATLSSTGSNRFGGQLNIPANRSTRRQTARVTVTADTSNGPAVRTLNVTLDPGSSSNPAPGGGSGPPGPPPI